MNPNPEMGVYKRPASPSAELSMPPAKILKTGTTQLQINYLRREKKEIIPLATAEESIPRLLKLISDYDGVLQRHESLAGNLGACPVGPILLRRFERLFEGPPRILKSNSRDPNISWLDVVEFAQNKPEQFDLEKTRNGVRVCQFYLKQCRVEISEEDYVLIRSGMPQKLIPPQPIAEDEEKELGVIDALERHMGKVIQSADQASARARQLVHRLKNRRAAIIARREGEGPGTVLKSNELPPSPVVDAINGISQAPAPAPAPAAAPSPPVAAGGFTAVNHRQPPPPPTMPVPYSELMSATTPREVQNDVSKNGISSGLATPGSVLPSNTNEDWMNRFLTPDERAAGMTADTVRRQTIGASSYRSSSVEGSHQMLEDSPKLNQAVKRPVDRRQSESFPSEMQREQSSSAVPIPSTPASLVPTPKQNVYSRDDGGPFKAEMIARMETMKRGERVIPPCDRCRRLHMDCIKNLTACQGCTKKHAKCSWKDITPEELESTAPAAKARADGDKDGQATSSTEWDHIFKQNRTDVDQDKDRTPSAVGVEPSTQLPAKSVTPQVSPPPPPPAPAPAQQPSQSHESSAAPFDVRPPPIDQQLRDAATEYKPPAPYHRYSYPAEEGDRLANIAAQVYRTASANAGRSNES